MTMFKTTAIAAVVAIAGAATLTVPSQAEANDAAIAAGIGGFVAGAIVGSHAQPRYVAPAPVVVYEQPVVVHRRAVRRGGNVTAAGVPVWHAQNCAARYRSYDWNTNTFVTYSGRVRQCR
ncbi:MAG: BA14K family protein [Pseudomonadota bacterium]